MGLYLPNQIDINVSRFYVTFSQLFLIRNTMIYGYARVSTAEQKLDLQIDDLKKQDCTKIITEKKSAGKERPELNKLLKSLRKDDTLVIWKLDRIGRNLREIVNTVHDLNSRGINIVSITQKIDTSTTMGRAFVYITAMFAEMERDTIIERTRAGLEAARARGRKGGRPSGLKFEAQLKAQQAKRLYEARKLSIDKICEKLDISRKTLYRWIKIDLPDVV
jgi:DNA invertase Pin-like site-specific DNA recombinase